MSNIIIGSYKYLLRKQLEKAQASGDSKKAAELSRLLGAFEGTDQDRANLSNEIQSNYENKKAIEKASMVPEPPALPIPEMSGSQGQLNEAVTNQPGMPQGMAESNRNRIIEILRNVLPENRQGPAVRKKEPGEVVIEGRRYRKLPGPYGYEEIDE